MLTDLQAKKLIHYFNVLDYNNNGLIQESDFIAIAENLCVLWGFKEGTDNYLMWINRFKSQWNEFRDYILGTEENSADLEQWLRFADKKLVNGEDNFYSLFVEKLTEDIFDLFDQDHNGYIEQKEFIDFFMAFRIEVRHSAKSFMLLDTNRDDRISKDELTNGVRAFFRSSNAEDPGNWLFGMWDKAL